METKIIKLLFEKESKTWSFGEHGSQSAMIWFEKGFKAHQELTKNKLFTIEDIKEAAEIGNKTNLYTNYQHSWSRNKQLEEIAQLILSEKETEYDFEIDKQGKIILL